MRGAGCCAVRGGTGRQAGRQPQPHPCLSNRAHSGGVAQTLTPACLRAINHPQSHPSKQPPPKTEADQYPDLREALSKLQLNDAALAFEPEVSSAMGFGFRCGFLGLLHMEIVQERLEREYDLDLITTAPTVVFRCTTQDGEEHIVDCPSKMPEAGRRESVSEPYVRLEMITPKEYVGAIMELSQSRRGEYVDMQYLTETRTTLVYNMPLAEVVTDFFDELKSKSKGYASMEYAITGE